MTIEKAYLVNWPYCNFSKEGSPRFWSKIKKLLFGLLLHEIRLEKMLDDHLVQNRALLDYRKGLFGQVAILEFFQRGEPMTLVQSEKTTLWSAFLKNTPRNNVR